jgi:ribosomal protein S18 acetylase RimI-like enzyme
VKIRRYQAGDLAEVVALWQRCGLTQPYHDPEHDIAFVERSPHAVLLVGLLGTQPVGTVIAGQDGVRGWLYRVGVDPEQRGRQLGRRLVAQAEAWLAAQGIRQIRLLIRPENAAVRDFYVRLGYHFQPRMTMAKAIDAPDRVSADSHIEVVVTYMEMTAPPTRPPPTIPAGKLALLRVDGPPVAYYRYLYDGIGEPWFWTDRRRLDDVALAAHIRDPKVEVYVLHVGGVPAGLAELDRRPEPDIGLAYFGLMPEFTGRGLGPYLLRWALDTAWQYGPRRITVDSCTLDHPAALAMYQRAGFVPYKQEHKVIDDPRLSGLIPLHRQPRRA